MAPPKRPWFRFYVETFSDVEIRSLPPAQRWVWAAVMGMARMSPVAGVLLDKASEPVSDVVLADVAAVKPTEVSAALRRFTKLGMVARDDDGALVVCKWDSRQFESDDVATRVARHRAGSNDRSNDDETANAPPDVTVEGGGDETVSPSVVLPEVQSFSELARGGLTSPTGHPLLAPDRPPSLSTELDEVVMALVDLHGSTSVAAAVEQLVADRRRFPWPSDARKALEAILGEPPKEADALEATQAAGRAVMERNRQRREGAPTCEACNDAGVVEQEDGTFDDCDCKYAKAKS